MTTDSNAHDLSKIALFAGLAPEAIREIASIATWRDVPMGETIFDQETDTLEVYCVVDGAVRILTTVGEREVTLAEIAHGNVFGEIAAIDGQPRSAKAVASVDSVLASIDGPAFVKILLKHPGIALKIIQRLARVVRGLDKRVTTLSTLTEEQRVVIELLRISEPDPKIPNGWYIPTMPVHSDIAGWAGTSRDIVAQTIGKLAREGVVKRRGMALVICDWPQLQMLGKVAAARD
jgi:CRP-like cAMP-binding protein